MEDVFTFQNIITLLFLIVYGIIFFIQKSQFKKQNDILEKYDKIFNIINVDEIEKYVQLQKKSTELSFANRESELSTLEGKFENTHQEIKEILASSKTYLEKSNEIKNKLATILERNNIFVTNLNNLNIKEFEEIHKTLKDKLTGINDKRLFSEIGSDLNKIVKKYSELKKSELKKL